MRGACNRIPVPKTTSHVVSEPMNARVVKSGEGTGKNRDMMMKYHELAAMKLEHVDSGSVLGGGDNGQGDDKNSRDTLPPAPIVTITPSSSGGGGGGESLASKRKIPHHPYQESGHEGERTPSSGSKLSSSMDLRRIHPIRELYNSHISHIRTASHDGGGLMRFGKKHRDRHAKAKAKQVEMEKMKSTPFSPSTVSAIAKEDDAPNARSTSAIIESEEESLSTASPVGSVVSAGGSSGVESLASATLDVVEREDHPAISTNESPSKHKRQNSDGGTHLFHRERVFVRQKSVDLEEVNANLQGHIVDDVYVHVQMCMYCVYVRACLCPFVLRLWKSISC